MTPKELVVEIPTIEACWPNEDIYDQTFQSIKPHHLEKANTHNIVMIFIHPLNFSLTPEPFLPNKWPLCRSSPVIIVPVCMGGTCMCVNARQAH